MGGLPNKIRNIRVADWRAGELRSGAWGYTKARLEDVLSVPPEQLWLRLTAQPGRLTWLRR